jgi:signal transduction histidine kinase
MKRGLDVRNAHPRRLGLYIATGAISGVLYIVGDTLVDARLGTSRGSFARVIEGLHHLIDWVLPVVAGALFGVFFHYLALRKAMAEAERRRAEDLDARLHKVERDQAVWVIAASLLHDLKNPLHTLGLLLDELEAPVAEAERARTVERCRAQLARLADHVDSLKTLPITDKPALPEIELDELVRRLVVELAGIAEADAIRLEVRSEPGLRALAAPSYLRIVLETLIENSLDVLRERGGAGEVDIDLRRAGDRVLVRVSDDGPGIPDAAAESIFEPLRTTKARGLGLGLAIARALSRSMKGDLTLERGGDEKHTTFRLELSAP